VTLASGSALLLAHGAAGTVRTNFGPMIASLSRPVRAFGPDFPGSGQTRRALTPLQLDDLADQLIAAADGVRTFVIVGYSMGCAVAVRAAIRHPERVVALVLTAGAPRIDGTTRALIDRWRLMVDGDPEDLAKFIVSVMFSEAFLSRLSERQLADFRDLVTLNVPVGTGDQVELVGRIDVTRDLPRVRMPTLVIGTRLDRLVAPVLMREYADGIPGARWAELDSGHAVAVEAPAAWARLVEAFLAHV